LAIVGLDLQIENLDEVAASIRLVRSLLPDGKIALVAETVRPIDAQRLLALSTEAGIFNLGSRDALLKVLEFIFLDQRMFVFPKSIATNSKGVTEPPKDSQSHEPSRLGINGHSLSLRENQVLASLVEGKSNKLIARVCHISEATVKVHLKAILRKLEARNRTQAAIWAIKHGYQNHFPEHKGSAVADTPTSF
jgi:two-component system nitrate/nitrite response regulator NarL